MEEEEYNDIQDQKYPQNAETSNVNSLIYKYHHSILVKKIMKRRVKIKCCVLLNQSDWGKVTRENLMNIIKTL
jgi:hypothetical protein